MSTVAGVVIAALKDLWTPLLAGVNVMDGTQANSDTANEWLFVGSTGSNDSSEVVSATLDYLGFGTKQENSSVTSAIVVLSGESSITTVRTRCYEILKVCGDAITADPKLGGVVMKALVSGHSLIPNVTENGAKARCVFTVSYLAQL